MANRVLATVRKMLNFAVQHDWIDANPSALIVKPGAEGERERVLTDDEIRATLATALSDADDRREAGAWPPTRPRRQGRPHLPRQLRRTRRF